MYVSLIFLLLLVSSGRVYSQFENGATTAECETLLPATSSANAGETTLIVIAPTGVYTPGDPLQVFIATTLSNAATGLVIQARRNSINADNSAVGSFISLPNDNLRLLECETSASGTVTNINNDVIVLPLPLMWTASENLGTIYFIASLVDTQGNIWSNVRSRTNVTSTEGELPALTIEGCMNANNADYAVPNCRRDAENLGSATCDRPSGSNFPFGTTTVTCTCSDRSETASCQFTVTISGGVGPCAGNPCQNGGTCIPAGTTFSCQCTSNFAGSFCETDSVGLCNPNPCSQNECRLSTSSLAGYTCHSITGVPC